MTASRRTSWIAAAAVALAVLPIALAGPHGDPAKARLSFELPAAADDVFALFEPSVRTRWDKGWQIEITRPTGAEKTRSGSEFHRLSDPDTPWRVKTLDRSRLLRVDQRLRAFCGDRLLGIHGGPVQR